MIGGHVVDPAEVTAEVETLSAEETIAWAIERFHPRPAVRRLVPEDELGDRRHRAPDRAPARGSSTSTPGCCSRETYDDPRRARRALRDRVRAVRRSATAEQPASAPRISGASTRMPAAPTARSTRCARPLTRSSCWVSGIRRVDSETRADAAKFGWDERFGLWKLNPLADWDDEAGLELHQGPPRPLQPASRPGLPVDRVHALHHGRPRGRGERAAAGPVPTGPSAASTGSARGSRIRADKWQLFLAHVAQDPTTRYPRPAEMTEDLENEQLPETSAPTSLALQLAAPGIRLRAARERRLRAADRLHGLPTTSPSATTCA